MASITPLPLEGLRVLDFGHTVMGPTCGLVLADLGAEVIRIEPPEGERTRRMTGFAEGFFGAFNRNKRSLAIDLKRPAGREVFLRLVPTADVLVENFAPGAMERLGLGWEQLRPVAPRLVYCALKGYLPGPYEHLPALDEVVQMQAGLAYMTGPSGRPLRAGSSVVDILGGVFGAIAILAALRLRETTGEGRLVRSALFESTAFLVAQHMAGAAVAGKHPPPMPERVSAWSVYEIFEAADGPVFIGITSDAQWRRFVEEFALTPRLGEVPLATGPERIAARPFLMPLLREVIATLPLAQVMARCQAALVPSAPVAKPGDLFEDPHLLAGKAMGEVELTDNVRAMLPLLPIMLEGVALGVRRQPPAAGEATQSLLEEIGLGADRIAVLTAEGVLGGLADA